MKTLRFALLIMVGVIAPQKAHAQTTKPPYTLPEILELVRGGFSTERILARITTDCIAFTVNSAAVAELQKAGADSTLAPRLRAVCNRPVRPVAGGEPAPPAQGVLDIVGELPPGWVRVVNELLPNDNRRITLTGGRPAVIVVSAPGWCPEKLELTMQGGEQRNWTPALRAKPWVGSC